MKRRPHGFEHRKPGKVKPKTFKKEGKMKRLLIITVLILSMIGAGANHGKD